MEEHAEKFVQSVPKDDALESAIETLEIEKARLVEAIRAMQAMAVTEDDYPATRAKEQIDALADIERVITFLRRTIDRSGRIAEDVLSLRRGSTREHADQVEPG